MTDNNNRNSYVNDNPDIAGTELEDSELNEVSNPDLSMPRAGGSTVGNFARGFKGGLTTGLNDNPKAGDKFMAFETLEEVKEVAAKRKEQAAKNNYKKESLSLDDLFERINSGPMLMLAKKYPY